MTVAPSASDWRSGSGESGRSVWAYFSVFAPAPEWDELPRWPPDVFALANLVLDHTEGYRFVVAPPPDDDGRRCRTGTDKCALPLGVGVAPLVNAVAIRRRSSDAAGTR